MQNSEEHANLYELQRWCEQTGDLHLAVSFYGDKWAVRVCPHYAGKSRPIRTMEGKLLEEICAKMYEAAKVIYEKEKIHIQKQNAAYYRQQKRNMRRDFSGIEAMHGKGY